MPKNRMNVCATCLSFSNFEFPMSEDIKGILRSLLYDCGFDEFIQAIPPDEQLTLCNTCNQTLRDMYFFRERAQNSFNEFKKFWCVHMHKPNIKHAVTSNSQTETVSPCYEIKIEDSKELKCEEPDPLERVKPDPESITNIYDSLTDIKEEIDPNTLNRLEPNTATDNSVAPRNDNFNQNYVYNKNVAKPRNVNSDHNYVNNNLALRNDVFNHVTTPTKKNIRHEIGSVASNNAAIIDNCVSNFINNQIALMTVDTPNHNLVNHNVAEPLLNNMLPALSNEIFNHNVVAMPINPKNSQTYDMIQAQSYEKINLNYVKIAPKLRMPRNVTQKRNGNFLLGTGKSNINNAAANSNDLKKTTQSSQHIKSADVIPVANDIATLNYLNSSITHNYHSNNAVNTTKSIDNGQVVLGSDNKKIKIVIKTNMRNNIENVGQGIMLNPVPVSKDGYNLSKRNRQIANGRATDRISRADWLRATCPTPPCLPVNSYRKCQSEMPVIVNREEFTTELQNYYSGHSENSKKLEWTNERIQNVIKLLDEYNIMKLQGIRPTSKHYHNAKKYDIMKIGNQKVLIVKKKDISDPLVQIIPSEEYYQKIYDAHIATGHGRRDKIVYALKDKYLVPIFAVTIFLNLCTTCLSKKSFPKKGIVVKPLISDAFNRRGQIDLIDFQTSPDEEYKWLLQYQDHLTKFCFLRPLKSKQAKEVAIEVLKIFLEVGCPSILQSDNGREFTASVLKEIVSLWPACKIVNGRPRHTQSQGSIERSNQDVKNMIRAWIADNKSNNWSIGCHFVQFQKNSSYHSTIGKTPYKALFGDDPKLGLASTCLSSNIISKLETEEDVDDFLEEMKKNEELKENDQKEKVNTNTTNDPKMNHEIANVDEKEENNIGKSPESLSNLNDESPVLVEVMVHKENKIENNYQENIVLDSKNSINSEINIKTKHENIDKGTIEIANTSEISNLMPNIGDMDVIIAEEDYLVCNVCNKESSGGHTCLKCKKIVHVICGVASEEDEGYGSKLLCNLCVNERNIAQERTQSHNNLKRVADKMLATSSKKFKDISIGSSVLVEIPKVDRGPLDGKNLIGKDVEKKNELYQVGTAFGVIKDWMPRNAVLASPNVELLSNIPESCESTTGKGQKKWYISLVTKEEILKKMEESRNHPDFLEAPHKCVSCVALFPDESLAAMHKQECHTEDSEFTCFACSRTFKQFRVLRAHYNMHLIGMCVYRCITCEFETRDIEYIKCHICPNAGSKSLPPRVPNMRLSTARFLYYCHKCDYVTSRSTILNMHYTKHDKNNPGRLKCDYCGKSYANKHGLKLHISKHVNKNPSKMECADCGKLYASKSGLKVHTQLVHRDQNPEEDPLYCNPCNKWFSSKSTHHSHMRNKHTPQEERKFECDECEKKFFTARKLESHKELHVVMKEGVKNHKCNVCGNAYYTRQVLRRHIVVYHENKPTSRNHVCEVCGMAFFTTMILKRHMARHSEARPYKCSVCGDTFKYTGALFTHIKLKHKKKKKNPEELPSKKKKLEKPSKKEIN